MTDLWVQWGGEESWDEQPCQRASRENHMTPLHSKTDRVLPKCPNYSTLNFSSSNCQEVVWQWLLRWCVYISCSYSVLSESCKVSWKKMKCFWSHCMVPSLTFTSPSPCVEAENQMDSDTWLYAVSLRCVQNRITMCAKISTCTYTFADRSDQISLSENNFWGVQFCTKLFTWDYKMITFLNLTINHLKGILLHHTLSFYSVILNNTLQLILLRFNINVRKL